MNKQELADLQEKYLFRGKCITDDHDQSVGDWVFGDVIHYASGKVEIFRTNDGDYFPVDPESVGQYIRKLDDSGYRIWDNSILKDSKGQTGKVFYSPKDKAYLVNWHLKDGSFEVDSCFAGFVVDEKEWK